MQSFVKFAEKKLNYYQKNRLNFKLKNMNYYLQAFKQYADFSGRANRTEFWMFMLFNYIAIFVLFLLVLGLRTMALPLVGFYTLGTLIPSLAITVRRLQDTGKSGWMILVSLIPFVGAFWLLVLLCQDSVAVTEYGVSQYYSGNETEQISTNTNFNLCPHCNSPIDMESVFCENCGNKIK